MDCPKCNYPNMAHSVKCAECGFRLIQPAVENETGHEISSDRTIDKTEEKEKDIEHPAPAKNSTPATCPECGYFLSANSQTCPNCSEAIKPQGAKPQPVKVLFEEMEKDRVSMEISVEDTHLQLSALSEDWRPLSAFGCTGDGKELNALEGTEKVFICYPLRQGQQIPDGSFIKIQGGLFGKISIKK